jgi:hypothetical protein
MSKAGAVVVSGEGVRAAALGADATNDKTASAKTGKTHTADVRDPMNKPRLVFNM